MRISARVLGADDLARAFAERAGRSDAAAQVALEESAQIIAAEAQRLITDGPKTGRIYKKYRPRREHQASAPNEPPASDLGTLVAGVVIDRADVSQGRITVESTAAHSKPLEFGTRHMAPRPFLRRAMKSSQRAVVQAFVAAYNRLRRR